MCWVMFSVYCLSCRQFSFESILICKTLLHGALSSLYIYHISDIALHVFICSQILSCFSSEFPLIKLSKILIGSFSGFIVICLLLWSSYFIVSPGMMEQKKKCQ